MTGRTEEIPSISDAVVSLKCSRFGGNYAVVLHWIHASTFQEEPLQGKPIAPFKEVLVPTL